MYQYKEKKKIAKPDRLFIYPGQCRYNDAAVIQRVIGEDQKPGDVVISKERKIFFIKAKTEDTPISYELKDITDMEPVRVVPADDPDYDIWKPDVSCKSPTEANMYACGLQTQIHPIAGNLVRELIQAEQRHSDSYIFYNALDPVTYALHQVIKAVYEIAHHKSVIDFEFLRSPGTIPRNEVAEGPISYLSAVEAEKKGVLWTDHSEKSSLLSVNFSFLTNFGDGAEGTYDIFLQGGLSGVDKGKAAMIIHQLLEHISIDSTVSEDIIKSAGNLLDSISKFVSENQYAQYGKRPSAVYQIVIPRNLIGSLAYISVANGHPFGFRPAALKSYVADAICKDPAYLLQAVSRAGRLNRIESLMQTVATSYGISEPSERSDFLRGERFTKAILEASRYPEFWTEGFPPGCSPQARLLLNPIYFQNPDSGIHIHEYDTIESSEKEKLQLSLIRLKKRAEIIADLQIQSQLYYGVRNYYAPEIDHAPEKDDKQLQALYEKVIRRVNSINSIISNSIFLPMESKPVLCSIASSGRMRVTCQGRTMTFNTYLPFQMTGPELAYLIGAIRQYKK